MSQGEMEPATADLPRWCLAHRLRNIPRSPEDPAARRDYDLYPIEIPRPEDDWTTAPVLCATCGLGLSCTVSSRGEIRRKGWRRRAAGLAMTVGGAGYLTALYGFIIDVKTLGGGLIGFLAILSIPAVASMLIGVLFVIFGARTVTGVKLQRDSDHLLRRPGAWVEPEELSFHGFG